MSTPEDGLESDGLATAVDDRPLTDSERVPAVVQKTPIPWRKVLPVYALAFGDAFNEFSLLSYVGYMVMDFIPELQDDKTKLGFSSGLLGSAFFIGAFFSSFFWGRMSDKFGRRKILLSGTTALTICSVLFGFSGSYWMAIVVRLAAGLMNGNLGITKTFMAEVSDSTNQVTIFAIWIVAEGLAGIVGSVVGGYLSRPAALYPEVFPPGLLVSVGVWAVFALVESKSPEGYKKPGPAHVEKGRVVSTSTALDASTNEEDDTELVDLDDTGQPKAKDDKDSLIAGTHQESEFWIQRAIDKVKGKCCKNATPRDRAVWSLWADRNAMMVCIIYAIIGFIWIMFEEVFPVWSIAPVEDGGLSFRTQDIGAVNAVAGIAILVNQTIIVFLLGKWGIIKTLKIGCCVTLPVIACFPFLNWAYQALPTWLFWAVAVAVYWLRMLSRAMLFAPSIQLIQNSVFPEHAGTTNGFGQSLGAALRFSAQIGADRAGDPVAFSRALGPFLGGTILAATLEVSKIGAFFTFGLLASVAVLVFFLALRLPLALNKPKKELTS